MEIAGYIASILIGIALGLIGGGGSVLTVPVLVYLFRVDAVVATGYSLFIVGLTSGIGSVNYFRKNLVSVKTAIVFGIPSIISVFTTRAWIVPSIPDMIYQSDSLTLSKSTLLLILFALLMIGASYSMIRKVRSKTTNEIIEQKFNYPLIIIEGIVVGALTGLVGAGGGFLIIPALVLLSKLHIKQAVGTSLVIISSKSLIGFAAETASVGIDWPFLLSVTAFAVLGIIIGIRLAKNIEGARLKPAFGWFILIMGIYIITSEMFFPIHK